MEKKLTYQELEEKCRQLEAREKDRLKQQKKIELRYKKEAVETLAGGIAHKFNNALSGIIGNIELLKLEIPETGKIDEYTEKMMAAARKMTELSSRLLAYAEGGNYQAESLVLSDCIKNTLVNTGKKFSPDITIKTEIPIGTDDIKGDPVQIRILLSALFENAAEAVNSTGTISVIAENKEVDEKISAANPGLKPGRYIRLKVIDNGKGMDKNTINRVFDPFFTTNFQGRGMGMAAVWGIVKSHNGWINVESEPDKGTCTTIYLPSAGRNKAETGHAGETTAASTGTILLIEDEKIVLEVERAMVTRLGYNVLSAQNGEEALSMLDEHNQSIDLVLLDLALPDMSGQELFPLLKEKRSDLKIIVCSGYSIDGASESLLSNGAQGFLQKPFRLSELASILKQHIDRRKHKRFKLNQNATARPDETIEDKCRILDISVGGLAFYYKSKDETASSKNPELSICKCMDSYDLGDIPFKTISDSPIKQTTLTEADWSGRCSIQFVDLSPGHLNQLDLFIKNKASD